MMSHQSWLCYFTLCVLPDREKMVSHQSWLCYFTLCVLPDREKMMSHQSCTHREQEPWVLHLRMPSDTASTASPASPASATAGPEKSKDCKILVWIASFHPKCYVETVSVCGAAPALHHLVCTPLEATVEPWETRNYWCGSFALRSASSSLAVLFF